MNWTDALAWVSGLDPYGSGITGWQLASVLDSGPSGCDFAYFGTDCGYNVDTSTSPLAHMFYVTLGNKAYYDTSGMAPQPGWGLTNTARFANLKNDVYWTLTEYRPNTAGAWYFDFSVGAQGTHLKPTELYAWAVHPGDVGALPTDSDGDGIPDDSDNCTLIANPDQFDGDGDGYGNRCDGDLNNNGVTNAQDYAIFRSRLGSADAAADLNNNGTVNAQDYAIFRTLLGAPPGPSGLHP